MIPPHPHNLWFSGIYLFFTEHVFNFEHDYVGTPLLPLPPPIFQVIRKKICFIFRYIWYICRSLFFKKKTPGEISWTFIVERATK